MGHGPHLRGAHAVQIGKRLKDRLATNVVPFAEFEKDAAAGALPDFSFIEPDMASGHSTITRRLVDRSSAATSMSDWTRPPACLAARPSWNGSSTHTAR